MQSGHSRQDMRVGGRPVECLNAFDRGFPAAAWRSDGMQIRVDTYVGYRGMQMPQCFRLGRSRIGIVETVDQWFGPDYRYIKVKGDDDATYILRVHDVHGHWELTMFKSSRVRSLPHPSAFGRRRH